VKGHKPLLIAVTAVVLAAAIFAYLYWSAMRRAQVERASSEEQLEVTTPVEEADTAQNSLELLIYQSTSRRPGRPVERKVAVELATSAITAVKARQITTAALQEIPYALPGGAVEDVYVLEDGTAVVDFSRDAVNHIRGGASVEYAILLTLTRSLMNNLEGVEQVRFLVGGLEQPTLAGHVSLATPFR
jgi:hypothetical protein